MGWECGAVAKYYNEMGYGGMARSGVEVMVVRATEGRNTTTSRHHTNSPSFHLSPRSVSRPNEPWTYSDKLKHLTRWLQIPRLWHRSETQQELRRGNNPQRRRRDHAKQTERSFILPSRRSVPSVKETLEPCVDNDKLQIQSLDA